MTPRGPVYPQGMPAPLPFPLVLVLFGLFLYVVALASKAILMLRRQRDQALDASEHNYARSNQLLTYLEHIQDMGPIRTPEQLVAGEPIPPCRFCGQGEGHWTNPLHDDCPSAFAWKVLQEVRSGKR